MIPASYAAMLQSASIEEWHAMGKAAEAQLRGDELQAEGWRRVAGYDLPSLTGLDNVARYGE